MPAGRYRVEVKKEGYEDWSGAVVVEPNRLAVVEAKLDKLGPKAGDTWREPVTGMELVWVPGGCYQMGCGSGPAIAMPMKNRSTRCVWTGSAWGSTR